MGGESRPFVITDLADRLPKLRLDVDMEACFGAAAAVLVLLLPATPVALAMCSLMDAWPNAPPADIIESGMVMYWCPPSACKRVCKNMVKTRGYQH